MLAVMYLIGWDRKERNGRKGLGETGSGRTVETGIEYFVLRKEEALRYEERRKGLEAIAERNTSHEVRWSSYDTSHLKKLRCVPRMAAGAL